MFHIKKKKRKEEEEVVVLTLNVGQSRKSKKLHACNMGLGERLQFHSHFPSITLLISLGLGLYSSNHSESQTC